MIMKLHKGQTLELSIDKMAYGGQGIARVNGLVVFLRGVVTGDKIRARVYRKKRELRRGSRLGTDHPLTGSRITSMSLLRALRGVPLAAHPLRKTAILQSGAGEGIS